MAPIAPFSSSTTEMSADHSGAPPSGSSACTKMGKSSMNHEAATRTRVIRMNGVRLRRVLLPGALAGTADPGSALDMFDLIVFSKNWALAVARLLSESSRSGCLAWPVDRGYVRVGQLAFVIGADGAGGVAVGGLRQGDADGAAVVGLNRDGPALVAALLLADGAGDVPAADGERVVPDPLVSRP